MSQTGFTHNSKLITQNARAAQPHIPGPKRTLLADVFGGWSITGITTLQSGAPYSVLNGFDRNDDGILAADRPDTGNVRAPLDTRGVVALPRPTSGARRCCRYDPLRMGLKTGENRSKKPTPDSCAFNPLLSGIRTSAGPNFASARVEVYIRPPTLTFSAHQNRSKNPLLCWPPCLYRIARPVAATKVEDTAGRALSAFSFERSAFERRR